MKRSFILFTLLWGAAWAQTQDDLRFRVLTTKGMVTAYHDENDETAKLYTSQWLDDGDKVTTGRDSEVVLRMKGSATLYLAPKSRIQFEKLRPGDKGPQCWIRLITGRLVCRLDGPFPGIFEIHAGSVRSHEHGTLFEAVRKEEKLDLVSYEGSLVVDYHGKTQLAKANEVLHMENGKFRSRSHHLSRQYQDDLGNFQELLGRLPGSTPGSGPARP